jgi:hypothetical protein
VLAAELRDPVGRDRPRLGLLRSGIPLGVAVDRRRGREHDADAGRGGSLEHAPAREQVAAHVLLEHVTEAAHAGLAGEMEDAVDAFEVELVLREVEARHVQSRRVLLLQGRVVVGGEAVDTHDVVPAGDERFREMRADEAGRTGDDVPHAGRTRKETSRMAR